MQLNQSFMFEKSETLFLPSAVFMKQVVSVTCTFICDYSERRSEQTTGNIVLVHIIICLGIIYEEETSSSNSYFRQSKKWLQWPVLTVMIKQSSFKMCFLLPLPIVKFYKTNKG